MNQFPQGKTAKHQVLQSESELEHFMNNNLETIERRDEALNSSIELNIPNKNNSKNSDDLIERLCNKNTKYREIIKLIDNSSTHIINTIDSYNNNTDKTTKNIIDMFQSKSNSLNAKMEKSKFCFLYNEISSLCTKKSPLWSGKENRIITPPNSNSNAQCRQRHHQPIPLPVNKPTKTLDVEVKGLKRTMSTKGALSSLRLQSNQESIVPWSIKNSGSFLFSNAMSFKKIYTLPSLKLNKKNYISSFSNDYYESELNKFSSRLNKDNKDFNLFNGNGYNNGFRSNKINYMKKYNNKLNKKSIFSLLTQDRDRISSNDSLTHL